MPEKKEGALTAKKVAAAKKAPAEAPKAPIEQGTKVNIYALDGSVDGSVDVPNVFSSDFRPDLIRRAVRAFRANRRQAYGSGKRSGMRHSVRWSGKGQGVSRVPRIRGTMIGAQAPGTVGGRRAHPPKPETIWAQKINWKERTRARNAALAATRHAELLRRRGHRFNPEMTLPIVVVDKVEETATAEAALEMLSALNLVDDVTRCKEHVTLRAGRGKMRGRVYRSPKSLLLVVSNPGEVKKGFGNLPGIDISTPAGLNAEILAPGGDPGRLTVFSAGAFEKLRGW